MKKINKVRDISLKNTRQPGDKYRVAVQDSMENICEELESIVERKISAESINTGHVSGLKDKEEIVLRCRYDIPKKKITMFIQMTDFITRFTCSGKFNPLEAKFTHKTYYWFNNTQTKK
ncbi:hypothetical protein A2W67_00905 [Candidatus Nomurabacteria bacterium RIFCSPLOWO2_02_40_28]|uniref:Uncharacterized protein n=2 Tax=Candidatus Nomuraibacteriota TaxID=1752729 RepID=A0A837HWJ1_9BACT|nr:MAG: hypothetical protein UT27_C0001G0009 [Candidatus Nomurabacteria bacterium GW2011_GWD2_39_12]KKR20724.1 MAG: hypothetical protein UT51_C0002G0159 [Candidatus Nomurabacteria bacterium GW2011_GWC2_39_41]KKR37348.1 MAG: hypothetical protein UT70_C0001G0024 [Candidatus Nomurabacteria bacterium GW2011_GWE2_40_10]KKR38595.1 MAG: hypothetical protein UT73_C0002G0080 [Candidatus Nomurabacteria bacterium GW2011_GWB1_40_11]KKR40320.1 MAG: hypothetical protein UT74_C0001G0054 [Parcubacteria group b